MKKEVTKLKKRFDASEYGGAPLLGLSKPVIKAHGSSDARAILNAVRQAERCVSTRITYEIACRILPDLNKQPAEPYSGN
jgi:glycerol-3-phosphate acyltransferase PlsX